MLYFIIAYYEILWYILVHCGILAVGKNNPFLVSGYFLHITSQRFQRFASQRIVLDSIKAFLQRVSPYKIISHNFTMHLLRGMVHTTAPLSPEDKDANVNTLPGLIAGSGADFRTSMPRGTRVLGILAQRCAVKELHEQDLVRLLRRHVVPL